ncbi:transaldolase family protein [Pseudooceanicola onchidii]|uniref:transaldolase family protein n=1 Tax=Pseudooceanicola onchidii TaxID=2562279 RepID=UPI0010AB37D4|nr:transaldolase family protein [Pseudooceanicola onchidii]
MDLYLDSAMTADWDRLMPTGLFTGITTNPLLAARAGLSYPQIDWAAMAQHAADLGASELHAQVYGAPDSYAAWADALLEAGSRAGIRTVVKVPLIEEAIRQVPALKAAGCPILMTACYDAKQMLVASALGADFIAPYFGRMLEAGLPAYEAMAQMLAVTRSPGNHTRVLIASLRDTDQLCRLSEMGHDCFTIAASVADMLLTDDRSVAAVQQFEEAARA